MDSEAQLIRYIQLNLSSTCCIPVQSFARESRGLGCCLCRRLGQLTVRLRISDQPSRHHKSNRSLGYRLCRDFVLVSRTTQDE